MLQVFIMTQHSGGVFLRQGTRWLGEVGGKVACFETGNTV